MNERMTALYEQAISEVWESRKGPDGLVRTDGNPYIFYEKFAELIVRDCLDIVNRHEYSYHEADPLWETAQLIKEHFGVEE
jgi:hypothetical protein